MIQTEATVLLYPISEHWLPRHINLQLKKADPLARILTGNLSNVKEKQY
jgi:hypothetical protein